MPLPAQKLHLVEADIKPNGPTRSVNTRTIVDSITAAIIEHRLMPGTKLGEQRLADLFHVSRTIVRQALNQLARDGLVRLEAARGAFVATPSVREAHEVFELRIMLETAMVRRLARGITDAQISTLRAHLQAERKAVSSHDVSGRTRLLADFHIVLANALGNEVLSQSLRDLLTRSSLISLMYQTTHAAVHSSDEHVKIVDALERRDGRAAARLIEQHIRHVERNLKLEPRSNDLTEALNTQTQ